MDPLLTQPKQFCKDARNFINFIKGSKSVDGILNFQFSWRIIVLNISGMTLSIVSFLSLAERFKFLDITAIKVCLAAIPVLSVLPFGGLLSLSVVGLMSMTFLLSLDKKRKIEKEQIHIKNIKLSFWSENLDLIKIQEKQTKYKVKVEDLQKEIEIYDGLINQGKLVEEELSHHLDQQHKIKICQKAIQELISTLKKKQVGLEQYEEKYSQWKALERKWEHIDLQELDHFREAKENKWKAKIDKLDSERRGCYSDHE